ncbi:MAG: 2Fe-2S iron-sulfur cluster-binding protein [Oligoflexia bacterium]|jgi:2Fe-2S ferredoxin
MSKVHGKTAKVTFLPDQQTVEAKVGESLLEIALQHDIPLHHACGGYCACTTCQVVVKQGAENLAPIEEEEQERLDCVGQGSRLGCQARVMGDVVVERVNAD